MAWRVSQPEATLAGETGGGKYPLDDLDGGIAMRPHAWLIVPVLAVGLLMGNPSRSSSADPAANLDEHAKAMNRVAQTPEGEQRVIEHLSRELNVPAATLRAQREQSKLGWGELSIAYRLSQKTGVPVNQLIAERKSGKGWGAIAKEHNVKLGPLLSEVKKSDHALKAEAEKVGKHEEAEKEDKAVKAEKERERPGRGSGGPGGGVGKGRGR